MRIEINKDWIHYHCSDLFVSILAVLCGVFSVISFTMESTPMWMWLVSGGLAISTIMSKIAAKLCTTDMTHIMYRMFQDMQNEAIEAQCLEEDDGESDDE